jgi:hypothetical protein
MMGAQSFREISFDFPSKLSSLVESQLIMVMTDLQLLIETSINSINRLHGIQFLKSPKLVDASVARILYN